jgi:hypothetical protein
VLDAIESLPPKETRELRRWVEDWQAWEEWERFRAKGWRIEKIRDVIYVNAPKDSTSDYFGAYTYGGKPRNDVPSREAIAAAAGIRAVSFYDDSTLSSSLRSIPMPYFYARFTKRR